MANRKLSRYRAKRDFSLTAEPQDGRATLRSPRLRYVIQKHAARRLHYDLRLELDGVFKSWAVTRGPSLNPADKRLAVEVEDHPLDYGDFEGTIPAGQYGGGTVQLWDRGFWRPLPGFDAEQGLRKGELKFELNGERLHGEWVLVRLRHDRSGGQRSNWLLIKHRDAAADPDHAEALLAEDRSIASGRSMAQIARGGGKSPTPFMSAKARFERNAVWQSKPAETAAKPAPPAPAAKPARSGAARGAKARGQRTALPRFVEPQLCTLVDRPPDSAEWAHEIKLDGYRLQLRVEHALVAVRTRKGLDWTDKFPTIAAAARTLPDCLIDGEVIALDAQGQPSFSALQAALSAADNEHMTFFAFDLLWLDGEDLRLLPLRERKARLQALLQAHAAAPIRYVQAFEESAESIWKSACRMDLEGIVSKRLDAPYRSGRSGTWTKAKCRAGHEVVIGGYTQRAGSVRSLLVGVYEGARLRYAGRVGTGFGQDSVALLQPQLRAQTTHKSPFSGADAPKAAADVHWLHPRLVAEIEFAGWTGAGMVRQAAFKGLRADKPAREVHAELPEPRAEAEQQAAALAARPAASARSARAKSAPRAGSMRSGAARAQPARAAPAAVSRSEDSVGEQRISHPDKTLWPDAGDGKPVSKLDLARYFEAVGDWLLPHVEGRPCSLVRVPDGIDGEKFFQRHAMQGMSKALHLVKVAGDRQPYVQIDTVPGLLAAAQIAALELHPWNCLPNTPDLPGRFVFDLDPAPDVAFNEVVRAALELKARLEKLGLRSFCKTTGGKGLHVVVPLARERRPIDWPTAKTFTQAVCAQMAADNPQRYLINMAKKERGGRIFLDYLRNDRMATAVAPLSPRARPGAPVSMPLNWPQVRPGLEPKRYTLRTAPTLLKRDQPWSDYAAAEQSLRAAIERFTRARDTAPAAALQSAGRPRSRSKPKRTERNRRTSSRPRA